MSNFTVPMALMDDIPVLFLRFGSIFTCRAFWQ